jgi:ATP-dependent helicase HrpB
VADPLPIEGILPELRRALAAGRSAVVSAPPGSGKSTRIPLALLEEPWLHGRRLLMLEPRRLAARAVAGWMASLLGEAAGGRVGYRIRLETRVGPATRVEVVTEGILTRLLQHDPSLQSYGAVLFDEFHERSLQADLGLALCLETRKLFREDLRLVVMSATLDCAAVAALLDGAPIITGGGRTFPVQTRHLDRPPSGRLEQAVAHTVRLALATEQGSILVFLPGVAEIRRVERLLSASGLGPDVRLISLYGDLPQEAQDRALLPPPAGRRKVVLATALAETSLTIEGIRIVVDAGLMRVPRFDPRSGLTRLDTLPVSQDAAEQRRGRAGRREPGVCYRLWPETEHRHLALRRQPEILEADLAPLALELTVWGIADPADLAWLDPPPDGALLQARDLLMRLGALDRAGRITAEGRRMASLALHPRLAHMILRAIPLGLGSLACDVAALLSERDLVKAAPGRRQADLRLRLDALDEHHAPETGASSDRAIRRRILQIAAQWRQQLGLPREPAGLERLGVLLAFAYPDRIAQRLPGGDGRFRLANGRGAHFPQPEALSIEEYLVIAELGGEPQWSRIFLAAPVRLQELEEYFGDQIQVTDEVSWDDRTQAVLARRQRRLGSLILQEGALPKPDPSLVTTTFIEGIRRQGSACLPWTDELRQWQTRVEFLRQSAGPDAAWPDVSDNALLAALEEWLAPCLGGMTRLEQLRRLSLRGPLESLLTWEQRRELERLAPTHLTVPSGSRIRLEYAPDGPPILAVRLQELFGCTETPRIVAGKVPIMLHLLSPAGRPVQVTQDLAGFWARAYADVRKELRGRYPKHAWPDDPLQAAPIRGAKRRT